MPIEPYAKSRHSDTAIERSEIACELEVNVGRRPVHGGEAIKTHRKVTNNLSYFMQQVDFFSNPCPIKVFRSNLPK